MNIINRHRFTFAFIVLLLLVFTSCEEDRPSPDVSHIEVDLQVNRFDQELFDYSVIGFRKDTARLRAMYGDFFEKYFSSILAIGDSRDSNLFNEIRRFVSDPTISEVYDAVQEQYGDIAPVESQLQDAWRHYNYYFPEKKIPTHIAFIGGFNTPLAVTDNELGLGLEFYLGADCRYYEYLQLPLYIRKRLTPNHLAPTAVKGWIQTEFILEKESHTLLDRIIHEGKILYCMDALFPNLADSLKIGYTSAEMNWAQEHAPYVYAHLVDNELLFSTEASDIGKFCNDGPFTVDLVKESPSRMGIFVGWQIVRAFMDQKREVDLPTLMRINEAQAILKDSKYKPKT